ncbi:MAG: signal peptidase II [Kangiellaceae bacterium]|nr:signal peptidase II [Kangiellaceae bacterium]
MPNHNPLLNTGLRWLWITILFFIIDQITKQMAVDFFVTPGGRFEVMPFFNFTLAYNKGAAFSFLADQGGWQIIFFSSISSIVSIGLIYWLYTLPAKNRWLSISLCFILAGALGNLYDRLFVEKGVIDFIDLYFNSYRFPAFNIADSVIFIGAGMMLWDSFMNPQNESGNADKDEAAKKSSNGNRSSDSRKV